MNLFVGQYFFCLRHRDVTRKFWLCCLFLHSVLMAAAPGLCFAWLLLSVFCIYGNGAHALAITNQTVTMDFSWYQGSWTISSFIVVQENFLILAFDFDSDGDTSIYSVSITPQGLHTAHNITLDNAQCASQLFATGNTFVLYCPPLMPDTGAPTVFYQMAVSDTGELKITKNFIGTGMYRLDVYFTHPF